MTKYEFPGKRRKKFIGNRNRSLWVFKLVITVEVIDIV